MPLRLPPASTRCCLVLTSLALLVTGCGGTPDDPQATPATPEGRARAAAVAFLRAAGAHDKDAWLRVADVPFCNDHELLVIEDRDGLLGDAPDHVYLLVRLRSDEARVMGVVYE